jgi:ASTRA-associated protein 1
MHSNHHDRHGKDNKLIVWKLTEQDEPNMSVALPVDDPESHRQQPWLLHVLHVNTLNFCSFAFCKSQGQIESTDSNVPALVEAANELLIALPNTINSESVS